MLATVAVAFMLNSFAFDASRWTAGERLVAVGMPAADVDAGYEWVGTHQPTLPRRPDSVLGRTFYDPVAGPAAVRDRQLGAGPPAGELVGTVEYPLFLVAGPRVEMYLYRTDEPGCTITS